MIGIIIQARLGSTRLPKKVLKPFAETNLLLFLINRLEVLGLPIVVATTTSKIDDELCLFLDNENIDYYRGSESNVLQRYIDTAKKFKISDIIRVCSDSPFIDVLMVGELLKTWELGPKDYLSYAYRGVPTVLCHYGVFVEFTSLLTLEKLNKEFDNEYYREHVTYGIYKNPQVFKVQLIELPEFYQKYEDIRLTVDTNGDYENIISLYEEISEIEAYSFTQLADYILGAPQLLERMKVNIKNNKKS